MYSNVTVWEPSSPSADVYRFAKLTAQFDALEVVLAADLLEQWKAGEISLASNVPDVTRRRRAP